MTETVKQNVTNASFPPDVEWAICSHCQRKTDCESTEMCLQNIMLTSSILFLSLLLSFPSCQKWAIRNVSQKLRKDKISRSGWFEWKMPLIGSCVWTLAPTPQGDRDVWEVCRTFQRQNMLGEELHWGLALKINSLASLPVFFLGFLCIDDIWAWAATFFSSCHHLLAYFRSALPCRTVSLED